MRKLNYREFYTVVVVFPIFITFWLAMSTGESLIGLFIGMIIQGAAGIVGVCLSPYICSGKLGVK